MDVVMKMTEGNPGALTVVGDLIKKNAAIDPDSALGPLSAVLALDELQIYESDIWILYKYVCEMNLTTLVALLRAKQLGHVSSSAIKDAVRAGKDHTLNTEELVTGVKDYLKDFGRNEPEEKQTT